MFPPPGQDVVLMHTPLSFPATSPGDTWGTAGLPVFFAAATPELDTESETTTRLAPIYVIILENDDFHTMPFVIHVIMEVFRYDQPKSLEIMLEAHEKGEAVCWSGSKEVGELKIEQMLTFHEKHPHSGKHLGPLGCRLEPAR